MQPIIRHDPYPRAHKPACQRQRFFFVTTLALLLLCLLSPRNSGSQEPAVPSLALTPQERAWLDENAAKITLFYNPTFPLIDSTSPKGEFIGIGADIIRLMEQRLGVVFIKTAVSDWSRTLNALKQGECAVVPTIVATPERSQYAFFTPCYISAPVVIIAPRATRSKLTFDDLEGRKVAVVSGFVTEQYVRKHAKGRFTIVPVATIAEGLRATAFGQVDALVENVAAAAYFINQEGIPSLHVAGNTDFSFDLCMGVSRKYPLLFSAMEKALRDIPPAELAAIRNRWISLRSNSTLDSETIQLLLFLAAATAIVLLTLIATSYFLKRQLNRKIASLNAAQQEIIKSEAKYRETVELAADGILVGGPDSSIIAVNTAACTLFDVPSAEILGKKITALPWQPESLQERPFLFKRINAGETITNYRTIIRPNGSLCYVEMRSKRMPDGYYQSFLRDITDRKKQEEELRANEENLRVTLDSIGDAVIATDITAAILRMNPVAEHLTGWSIEEAAGRPLNAILNIVDAETRQPVNAPDRQAIESGTLYGLPNHTLLLARGGGEYRIDESTAPIRDNNGRIIGMVLVFRDVTEEHALQEQLRHSQKLDAIGQLAGGVAHDFNNMLGGIMAAADMLAYNIDHPEKLRHYLKIITDSAERAADLTGKLLAFSRKQPAATTVIDAHAPLRDTLSLMESTFDRRIRILFESAAEKSFVVGDSSHLQSAFLNLGINAAQAMPEGGMLEISTRLTTLAPAYCQASPFQLTPGMYLDIEFRDTGCGIAADLLPHIFDPFFTTKEPGRGTGLGLCAVRGTVQQHNGAITVYSVPGIGTSFHILLPLAEGSAPPASLPSRVMIPGSGRILLVDDEAIMRAGGRAILEELGYEVAVAEDGVLGLERFREAPDSFDLVILDMIMPQMNGTDCFHAMRALRPEVKIILASGFSREEDIQQIKAAGLCAFIQKPFRSAQLSQVVHDVLAVSRDHA